MLLYRAFAWDPPSWIHLPLILDKAGGKLSKRQGDISVSAYREQGYLPEALVNYLALLGWSTGDGQEILSREDLVGRFAWERISTSPAIFDLERLNWFNRWYVRQLPTERIAQDVAPYLKETYGRVERSEGTAYSPQAWLELLVDSVREEVDNLGQLPVHVSFAFLDELAYTAEANEALRAPGSRAVLETFVEIVRSVDSLDVSTANTVLEETRSLLKESKSLGPKEVMFPIRASLTGSVHGPELAVVMALLGKEECLRRGTRARNSFSC